MRKVGETILGFTLLIVGAVLSIPGVPGPGIVVIILGLVILAKHYHWAHRALEWARHKYEKAKEKLTGK